MLRFKKILRSLLFIVLFLSFINCNLFGKCSSYSKKDDNNVDNTTSIDSNVDSKKDDNNPDPIKGNPPQQKPPQDEQNELNQLYSKFCTLYEYVSKNYDKITTGVKYKLSTIKSIADENKDNKIILEQQISILDGEKKKIDAIIAIEENNKKPDPGKDNNEITEIESVYDKIPIVDINENYDLSGININFNDKKNFKFKSSINSTLYEENVKEEMFLKLDDLIKHFLAKKKLKGNFTIDYIKPEHVGINPILKIKITKDHGDPFHAFIKNELCNLLMFKLFQIVDLLPFEYYIDVKNKLIITEDIVEKKYKFLDNQYCPTTLTNKEMWKNCTNMNEFRFLCYILNCDDIDPMFKYDNCCFKDNKVYALDLRCINIDSFIKLTSEKFFMEYYDDYNGFLRCKIREINTNKMAGFENTEQYKIWKKSIDDFKDFTDDEKISINDKIIKLIYYIVGIFKDNKIQSEENQESKNYLSQVCCNIMNFLQYYICKYKKEYTKFEYNGKTLEDQYDNAKSKLNGYSYGRANGIFKKLLDENKLKFEYFLTSDTLVKLYDIYRNKPDDLFYGYIITDVNTLNL